MKPTHIVFTYPSQDSEIMFRACDGMMIAERQKTTLIFGENPNAPSGDPKRKQSRVFMEGGTIDHLGQSFPWNENGSRYMRTVVAKDDFEGRLPDTQFAPYIEIDPEFPPSQYRPVVIEERCQEGGVILAPDSLDMRTNGGGMSAVNINKIGRKIN
jgi:hypothetical protein